MENTEISWTDSTFNPWVGCSKVGPGCDHCYAEALDHRFGHDHWGADKTPRTMSNENWRKPIRWNSQATIANRRSKVFCGSMCDWADNNAPDGQRERLISTIAQTPMLDWQLLTKRAPNIRRFLPADWGSGYANVWLGVTVENRFHGLPRIDVLREIPATVRFLSVEPLLEDLGNVNLTGIDWVIVGGESGASARPMELAWVNNIRRQCEEQNVSFFFKQHGGRRGHGGCLLDGVEVKHWPIPRVVRGGAETI
jgi:protein gp37